MKIWHISDTHGHHEMLNVPQGIDMIIHTGDASTSKDSSSNHGELFDFMKWYGVLNVKYKIFIPGNHEVSIDRNVFDMRLFENNGIIYLFNSSVQIEGINIYGSPYCPSFGNGWAFMRARGKLAPIWDKIPEDTDILATHGPPKGILDLTENYDGSLEQVGDRELSNRIIVLENLKAHLFGHIHDSINGLVNRGVLKRDDILYSNASIVRDGHFGEIQHNGNLITIL